MTKGKQQTDSPPPRRVRARARTRACFLVTDEVMEGLRKFFTPHNKALEELLGQPLPEAWVSMVHKVCRGHIQHIAKINGKLKSRSPSRISAAPPTKCCAPCAARVTATQNNFVLSDSHRTTTDYACSKVPNPFNSPRVSREPKK